ncbi:ATP-binding protein [Bowmanella denitrificans]|uniref:ATP-binding protein n=1 Tax=Bowmanella denitrificans TaxID=366582 RepID=UPI000C9A728A|nr:ATP-binding protein [Bowmanella denitrificans]
MGRLFVSLYVFIVLSLVGLAAVLDKVFLENDSKLDPWVAATAAFVSQQLSLPENLPSQLDGFGLKLDRLDVDSIAWPQDMAEQLQNGQPLVLFDDEYGQQLYILDSRNNQLLQIYHPDQPSQLNVWLYSGVFFALLALLLSLWTWPLWRDLSKLREASRSLRQDGSLPAISVGSASALSSIMHSFNQLGTQIKQLVQNQRELTGAVAHEFRTPLSRLKFALAMEPPPGSAPWQDMTRDVEELERLVQEMLDYASMENTAPEMDYSTLPLAELVEGLANRMAANCPPHIKLELQLSDAELLADGYFVQRALQNIMQNAMRYAKSRILVSIETDRDEIRLMVDDDGQGVEEADKDKIFEPFFRPDAGRDRKRGGAGLGLAIVRRIQQWHQGSCKVERSPLGGARFILRYPQTR